MDRDMRSLEHEQRLVGAQRETLDGDQARMRQREEALTQREEVFRRRLNEALDTQVRNARREIDAVIDDLKAKVGALAREHAQPARSRAATPARFRTGARDGCRRDRQPVRAEPPRAVAGDAPATRPRRPRRAIGSAWRPSASRGS